MAKSSTSFKPGQSGNPDGAPKERVELRRALEGDAQEIHDALMALVRGGNAPAIIYAHTQLVGKPKERVEVSGPEGKRLGFERLSREELLAIAGLGETDATKNDH